MDSVEAVIFDLDDTLIDHKNSFFAGLNALRDQIEAFQAISLAELIALYQSLLDHYHQFVLAGEYTTDQARHERTKAMFAHVGYTPTDAEIEETVTLYRTTYLEQEQLIPGALELITALRERGIPIGVITNHASVEQRAKLERRNLNGLIDEIVISGEVGIAKPDRQIFDIALKGLDRQIDETVMVGDNWDSDIVGAASIGMRAIWLNRYDRTAPDDSIAREITSYIPLKETLDTFMNW